MCLSLISPTKSEYNLPHKKHLIRWKNQSDQVACKSKSYITSPSPRGARASVKSGPVPCTSTEEMAILQWKNWLLTDLNQEPLMVREQDSVFYYLQLWHKRKGSQYNQWSCLHWLKMTGTQLTDTPFLFLTCGAATPASLFLGTL